MASIQASALQEAIEKVEALPLESQEVLLEVVRKRLIEQSRARLADEVREGRAAYLRGDVLRGSAAEIMADLYE